MKAWKKKLLENGDKTGDHNMKESSVASRIMAKPYTITPDFDFNTDDLNFK